MAKQVIQLGSAVNDGTGDPLRTAFNKVNSNFTELYTTQIPSQTSNSGKYLTTNGTALSWATVSGNADLGNFKIQDNFIGTTNDNDGWGGSDIYLSPNGEGYSYIHIPNDSSSTDGGTLTIGNGASAGGGIQLSVNNGNWTFNNGGTVLFPTIQTNLHNGGNQNAQTLQFSDPEQQVVITGPTPTGNNSAQRLIIQGQRGAGTGEGGDVYFWGGDAQNGGGDIKIYAGDADSTSEGYGGYVNIDGGNGFTEGGNVSISGGNSSGGDGANVYIRSGYGVDSAHNGLVSIQAGNNTWQFANDGKLSGPAETTLQLESNLLMNTDRGFVVEMGRFPMAVDGDDWWFDVSINRNDGYVYCFGGADEANEALIVKFDSHGNVVWQNTYTKPTNWGLAHIISADFKDANTIVVVGMSNVYDPNTDSSKDYIVSFEVQTSNGNVVSNSGYALTATDTLENWTPYIWASNIRYNAGKTQFTLVGSTFGDVTNFTITVPSAISTTPGVLKVSKSAIDTAFGTTSTPFTYSNAWTIRGYGFTSTNQFTDSTVETIEGTEYYVLTTDSDVDFTTLPNGESWIIRYYDTESAYITTGSWEKKVDYLGQDQWFNAVGFDSTGNIYAGGASGLYANSGTENSLLVSFTSTGTLRWAKRLDDTSGAGYNNIRGLAVDQTNNYIYTCANDDDGGLVVAKVNTSGAVSWIKTITMDDGMSDQYNSRIIYCPVDSSIVIAMEYSSITSYNDDFLLMKLNTDGDLQWALSFGSSGEENVNWEYGHDFLSADDNFIYVAGSRYTGDDDNATLFAIPHDGIESGWVGIHNVRNSTDNLTLTTGTTSNTSVAVTTTTLTNVDDYSYITLDGDSEYPTRKSYLNGGNNKLKNVAEIEFADGSTQRTSASDIPQIEVLSGGNEIRLHAGHRGGHIKVTANTDNHTIIVPTHAENPLPIGMVVTIVLDQASDDCRVYITGQDDGLYTVNIRPVGSDVYYNRYWSIGGDNVQGLYTLMKIEQNVWILSGATINNED